MNPARAFPYRKSVRIAIPFLLVALLAWFGLTGSEPRARIGSREEAAIEPAVRRESPAAERSEDAAARPTKPEEEEKKKNPWVDPVETGSATLEIELADAETHRPAPHLKFELWRLDAPGNEDWFAGDQQQARARTDKTGLARIVDLPEGPYRVICSDAAPGSEDPPAFRIDGGTTRVRLEVPLPKPIRTFVRVYDEHGNLLESARRNPTRESRRLRSDSPEWMRPRRPRDPGVLIGMGGGAGGSFHRPYSIRADARGFDLGWIRANTRRSTIRSKVRLAFHFATTVLVEASGEPAAERTYAAVVLPVSRFLQSARLADGSVPEVAGAHAIVTAVEAHSYDALLSQTCRVKVLSRDFKALEFDWCPAEEPPPLVLEPEE